MDFLDPKKQKAHARRLAIGYALIGLVLILGTTILLYLAYGFGLDRNGRVIQNGLVFLSSQPAGATIYINGELKDQTNTRLVLPAGSYTAELKRDGYYTWKRAITVEGGSVGRFDYPFLIPSTVTTTSTKQYTAAPGMVTQSLDRRWIIVQNGLDTFDIYDTTATKPAARAVNLSSDLYTPSSDTKSWAVVEWADDDRHVLLKRTYVKSSIQNFEYILFDRQDPASSQNLGLTIGLNPTIIDLRDHKYDQYYLFDQNAQQVLTASLKKPTPQPYLKDVLAMKTDGDIVEYVTDDGAPAGKVFARLRQGDTTYTLRQMPVSSLYLLELAEYNNSRFIAAGAQSEDKVYVYKDPIDTLRDKRKPVLVPVQILKVVAPTYVSFSTNARFIMAENADHFAVYDAETDKGYAYQLPAPLDDSVAHATWMDGFHLSAVSGGKLTVFDFDGANSQNLMPMSPAYAPFFDRNYRIVYAFTAQNALTGTNLFAPQDK